MGVNTSTPGDDFTVQGVANASNVRITSATANGIFYAGSSLLALTDSNLTWDGTTFNVSGTFTAGNITISGSDISSSSNLSITTATDGNLTFTVPGNGVTQIVSTTSLTLPTGNTSQRPGTPDTGSLRFNSTTGVVEVYTGLAWETVGSDLVSLTDQTIVGDGSTVIFTLDQTATATSIFVSTNGVVQKPNSAYTVTGNSITFAEPPLSTDVIDVRFIAQIQDVIAISNSSGNNSISVDENGVGNLLTLQSVQLPTYTVSQANALANVASGQIIYVSNGDSGTPCLAVYSINAWKIVALGGNITT